jgi:hypothetical protein
VINIKPIAAVLENGPEKLNGFIMKLTLTGLLFELDKINFRVGSILKITFSVEDGLPITESVRSIKHYDRFFRTPPKKKKNADALDPEAQPKRLVEAHFVQIKEESRKQIMKYLMSVTVSEMKKRK